MWLLSACVTEIPSEAALVQEAPVDTPAPRVTPARPHAALPAPEADPCATPRPLPGDLRVGDGADAAGLCGAFNAVEGTLTVEAVDWPDLSPLSCLCEVGGNLVVRDAPNLASLTGLERLQAVHGRLTLQNLDALLTVDLPALVRVDGRMSIEPNADLLSVAAPLLVRTGSLSVQYAPDLGTLVFPSLGTVDKDLALYGSDTLPHLEAFAALTRVGGVVYLDDLDGVRSLHGLEALKEVGSLEIVGADHLASLDGLVLAQVPGTLLLDGNPALQRLDALRGLTSAGTVDVRDNDALGEIDALGGLREVTGDFIVTRNDELPSSAAWAVVGAIGEENIAGTVTID